jgi:hypothetical protein
MKWLDDILDKIFGFDKYATKDDIKKLEMALNNLLKTIKQNDRKMWRDDRNECK